MEGEEIWSHHCNQTGQNLVAAHLFEWPWHDVAAECENYLGPAGFTVVQVTAFAPSLIFFFDGLFGGSLVVFLRKMGGTR